MWLAASGTATLSVLATASPPAARISWTTGGNGPTGSTPTQPFPAGTFTAGAVQTVGAIAQNQWAESCWTFSYSNTTFPAAGTYTGRVLYTLTAP